MIAATVNAGVLLFTYAQSLQQAEGLAVREAVLKAARLRLRPHRHGDQRHPHRPAAAGPGAGSRRRDPAADGDCRHRRPGHRGAGGAVPDALPVPDGQRCRGRRGTRTRRPTLGCILCRHRSSPEHGAAARGGRSRRAAAPVEAPMKSATAPRRRTHPPLTCSSTPAAPSPLGWALGVAYPDLARTHAAALGAGDERDRLPDDLPDDDRAGLRAAAQGAGAAEAGAGEPGLQLRRSRRCWPGRWCRRCRARPNWRWASTW
ncbi:MAG: efflux RND transporter permease subunit [Desulfosudis oleivorans]|nr:efflux RND transporter permease subunit [Desulfosudis oleivorans]